VAIPKICCNCGKEYHPKTKQHVEKRMYCSRQCGLQKNRFSVIKHGMSETRIYEIWRSAIGRCHHPKATGYGYYGAKGISVCQEWRESFEAFHRDMGELYFDKADLDRIDNEGNYNKENCRWITHHENTKNRRDTVRIILNGNVKCLKEACEDIGICPTTVKYRMRVYGLSAQESFELCTLAPHDSRDREGKEKLRCIVQEFLSKNHHH
jgi:hypothetical protein